MTTNSKEGDDDLKPEPLEAEIADIDDVFPDPGTVHEPPSEADAPAP